MEIQQSYDIKKESILPQSPVAKIDSLLPYREIKPIISLGQKCMINGKLFKPHGIAINEDMSLLYIAEGNGVSRISVFSCQGNFVTYFSHDKMICPWGIAIKRDNIYVTDMDGDMLFNFQQDGMICRNTVIGSFGSGNHQFNGPNQLAVSNNGDVYITDIWNHRIKVLDCSLQFLRNMTHPSMSHPVDVKLLLHELYVLSCEDSPSVHVFSYEGEIKRSLITQGSGEQIYGANFFCLDSFNNIFISDWVCHQVKIFSGDKLIRTIGEEGHESGMFWYPYGIAVTPDFLILIASLNKNHTLQIFSSKHCI